jgi:hypothetical protein
MDSGSRKSAPRNDVSLFLCSLESIEVHFLINARSNARQTLRAACQSRPIAQWAVACE